MIILAALALAAASPPAPPPRPTQAQLSQAMSRAGFSPAAIAILTHPPAPKADQAALSRRSQQIGAAIEAAVQTVPFDPARFERALRDREAFRSQIEGIRLEQLMQIMRLLPPADRSIFARSLVAQRPAGAPPPIGMRPN